MKNIIGISRNHVTSNVIFGVNGSLVIKLIQWQRIPEISDKILQIRVTVRHSDNGIIQNAGAA